MSLKKKVLKSKLGGKWYSSDPTKLSEEIDRYLKALKHGRLENVMAVVLPHAGYAYSGMTLASGINQLKGRNYSRVIVIGPSHEMAMPNKVSIPHEMAIETPLGQIELDIEFIKTLLDEPFVNSLSCDHAEEHSIQIELPFLQKALGDFKVVPIVSGHLDEETARTVAHKLLTEMDKDSLVVISSDFTHYGKDFNYMPFTTNVEEKIDRLDMGALAHIQAKDLSGFLSYLDETGATICGRSPIAILLAMLPKDAVVHMLKYDTSGQLTGDWDHCVSYMSIAVSGRWIVGKELDEVDRVSLNENEQYILLDLARQALEYYLEYAKRPSIADLDINITDALRKSMGVFVTLKWHDHLRGCIGEIFAKRPIFEAVLDHAVNAGVNDPRFSPVSISELNELEFEISALDPPRSIASYKDIVIGKHGIVLEKGGCSSVFLPQVPVEQGWDISETLSNLAEKAGLSREDWREDCQFKVFEADVLSE